MLSRVAENLLWISRYVERAENVARLIDAARRMVALPRELGQPVSNEWSSVLIAAGARDELGDAIERADAGLAIDHLIFDRTNPSSVVNCLHNARENARAVRFALTQESWEALNAARSEMRAFSSSDAQGSGLSDLLDWIKAKSATFRGATHGTMLRGDGYEFIRVGAAIERIDSTARLIDVKYHVLLPSVSDVGSGADRYQWLSLLQAASAQRAYYASTKGDMTARSVAAFLILHPHFPRSLVYNMRLAADAVSGLSSFYGQPSDCDGMLQDMSNRMQILDIDAIMATGLHEFLTDVIERNYAVANLIGQAYGFAPAVGAQSDDADVGSTGQQQSQSG